MESNFQNIIIRIKTLDNSLYDLKIPKDISVSDLKAKIEKEMKVPINRQRIIFQGKLLNNTEILSQLKVENGHVLHLIALPNNIPVIDNDHSQQNPTNPNINSNSNPIPNQEIEFLNGVFRTINESSTQRRSLRRRVMQQRINGFNQNINDAKEVMRQNLVTVQQILSSFVSLNDLISNESFNIYNFQNRKFQIGQWVDVKDSNDQWLEGQINNMNHSQILVHFTTLGIRRDEWIDINSVRITPFRSHTVQSLNSPFMSPFPTSPIEGEKSLTDDQQFDLHDFLYEFGLTLNQIFSLLFGLNLRIEKSDKSEQGGQNKNQENEIDMKTFINGMIEDQKQTDPKFNKNEIDVASLKSLKSVEKNSIDYDASSMKSIKSYISNSNWSNFQMPTAFQGYISEENEEDESQDVSDSQSNMQAPPIAATRELENYLIASQIAPLFDRMGRLMVDISPFLAMHGANLQHHFTNIVNVQNLSNVSIITNEGSISSNAMHSNQNTNVHNSNSNRTYFFQVPVMLTPSELLNGASQNYLPTSRLENSNVDIHIHTVVNSVAAPPNMSLPENNLNLNSISTQTVPTRNVATDTDDLKENFEEEKCQYSNQNKIKQKEKRNFGFKSSLIKEQEYINSPSLMNLENNRAYFKDLQTLKEEKEIAKTKFQHTAEFYDHKEPKHVSFKGLKKIGEERNRTLISKLPKTKSFFSKDEKELTSKNLLKKTQEHENNPKFPINNNNNLSPTFSLKSNDLGGTNPCERKPDSNISFSNIAPCLKSNENLPNNPPSNNNINNINQNDPNRTSNTSNNSNTSRMSNCGKQLY